MFNLEGFLAAQAVAWAGLAVWKLASRKKPKALLVESPDVSYKFVMPVIAFVYQKSAPMRVHHERIPLTRKQRFEILRRDNFTCQYCGRKPPEVTLEVDHKVSVYNGGSNHPSNLITSCLDCNRGKGAKSVRLNIARRAD